MLIDWFTVAAQAVNFLILMWLLKRFLYKPVLNAIDAREAHIVDTVKNAEEQHESAEAARALYAKKNEDFERERADLTSQAREDAKAMSEHLLEKERATVDAMREKWQNALADEQQRFGDEIAHRIQDEVFAISRQVLDDLSDTTLEERMVEVFYSRLRQAKDSPNDKLAAVFRAKPSAILVKSAFTLSPEQEARLRRTFTETFPGESEVTFETDAKLIGGIALVADGQKISWTVSDYLDRLENDISAQLTGTLASRPAKNASQSSTPRATGRRGSTSTRVIS